MKWLRGARVIQFKRRFGRRSESGSQSLKRLTRPEFNRCDVRTSWTWARVKRLLLLKHYGAVPLLMDEQRGVRCARQRGMIVIRTPPIYADAAIRGLIGSVREKLDALRATGFWLTDRHYDQILRETGEL